LKRTKRHRARFNETKDLSIQCGFTALRWVVAPVHRSIPKKGEFAISGVQLIWHARYIKVNELQVRNASLR
jgi:hypothetical protein